MNTMDTQKQYIGIDIGSQKTMVVRDDGEIVLTDTGSISRPTLLSFSGKERIMGEEAFAHVAGEYTIPMLNTLLGKSVSDVKSGIAYKHRKAPVFDDGAGRLAIEVDYCDEKQPINVTALLGMFIAHVWNRIVQVHGNEAQLSFSLPPNSSPSVSRAYVEAAAIAGIDTSNVFLADAADCLIAAYTRKLSGLSPTDLAPIEGKFVLIVDMGHTQTTAVIAKVLPLNGSDSADVQVEKVAVGHNDSLGAYHFDVCMFDKLAEQCKTQHKVEVVPGSKTGFRLIHGCEKLRKLLSQLHEARVTVERVAGDIDSNFAMTRDELSLLASDLLAQFKTLLVDLIEQASLAAGEAVIISAVEILGGGARMQIVQHVIHQAIQNETIPLGAKLDDSTYSVGAALVRHKAHISAEKAAAAAAALAQESSNIPSTDSGANADSSDDITNNLDSEASGEQDVPDESSATVAEDVVMSESSTGLTADEVSAARAKELEMQTRDKELHELLREKNKFESFILEMRSAPRKKHGDKIDNAALNVILNEHENWMWDTYDATLADYQAKYATLHQSVKELCTEYYSAVEEERVAVEKALEEEAARGAAERAAEGGEDEDHDTRKLKKADRMRLVVKNKEEGTELFKGKNYRPAAARYQKALSHCAKFFDLNAEDEIEVKALKLSLYLNLATCYVKLQVWEQVLRNCDEALSIDPNSVKARFRRSSYYESKKEWNSALADVKFCQSALGDKEDKLVTQAYDRIKKMIQKEKDKEKKTWGKVFG